MMTASVTLVDSMVCDRASGRSRAGLAVSGMLAGTLALVWGVSLTRSLFYPLGPDQAFFQYITDRVMAGQRMYVDVWDQNGPGIVGIHWLSTLICGRSPMALRVFDAGWQLLTLTVLVALGVRDGRRWSAGLLAAILYALMYYGAGCLHTAQREGFTVLPILLAAHAVVPGRSGGARAWTLGARYCLAGVMGLLAFAIKPPLGLCFGVLWLQALAESWRDRRMGWSTLAGVAGLAAGFLLSATVGVMILICLGSWSAYWPILLRVGDVPPGFVTGHWKMLEMIPRIAIASGVMALVLGLSFLLTFPRGDRHWRVPLMEWLRSVIASAGIFALLVTAFFWPEWRGMLLRGIGVFLPVVASLLVRRWTRQSRIWWIVLLLGCASLGSVFLEGFFNLYHFFPVLACASYLAANEVVGAFGRFNSDQHSMRVWAAVCLATMFHMGYAYWWREMARFPTTPFVLAGTALYEHYGQITDKMDSPPYATKLRVAQRLQELTGKNEPIAILFFDPWLYYLAQRPPAHRMVYVDPSRWLRCQYPDFMRALQERKAGIALARIPRPLRDMRDVDRTTIQQAVYQDLEAFFGPPARVIRDCYQVSEIIDEVCLLEPKTNQVARR